MERKADLIDSFGRRITYVRLSVTDRCDLRCRYCMAEQMEFLPRATLLTLEEIVAARRRLHRARRDADPADRRRAAGAARHRRAGRAGSASGSATASTS